MLTKSHLFSYFQKLLISLCSILLISGCQTSASLSKNEGESGWHMPYKPPIQQGNQLNKQQLAALKNDLTKVQVQYLLGLPLVEDAFQRNRWDYVYSSLESNQTVLKKQRVSIFFKNGKVSQITASPKELLKLINRTLPNQQTVLDIVSNP